MVQRVFKAVLVCACLVCVIQPAWAGDLNQSANVNKKKAYWGVLDTQCCGGGQHFVNVKIKNVTLQGWVLPSCQPIPQMGVPINPGSYKARYTIAGSCSSPSSGKMSVNFKGGYSYIFEWNGSGALILVKQKIAR